jgi:hypothetical protein
MADEKNGSIISAMFWMFVISLLLFWLPGIGAFIAGLVGGRKAGGVGSAIVAVFLPGIIFSIALIAGLGGLVLSLSHIGSLLLGAIIGSLIP